HNGRTNQELALRHRALFIGFTPASDPRVAGVAVLERAAWGGRDAAPIVRDMFDAWARLRHLPDTPLPGDTLPAWAPLSLPAGTASSAPVTPAVDLPHASSVLNRARAAPAVSMSS
ncbi:Penicillin-binding protein, transpeptidase domain protein, partial [mine drainage metagenome]